MTCLYKLTILQHELTKYTHTTHTQHDGYHTPHDCVVGLIDMMLNGMINTCDMCCDVMSYDVHLRLQSA